MTPDQARKALGALLSEAVPPEMAEDMAKWEPFRWEMFIRLLMTVLPGMFSNQPVDTVEVQRLVGELDKAQFADQLVTGGATLMDYELAKMVEDDHTVPWPQQFIADMRSIGLLIDYCDGCGKPDCTGCPCGSTTSVNHNALTPEASATLRLIFMERDKKA